MRPHSSVKGLSRVSYTCFTGTRVLEQLGEIGPKYPNHAQRHMKSNPKSSATHFIPNCLGPLKVELYLFCRYLDIGPI